MSLFQGKPNAHSKTTQTVTLLFSDIMLSRPGVILLLGRLEFAKLFVLA